MKLITSSVIPKMLHHAWQTHLPSATFLPCFLFQSTSIGPLHHHQPAFSCKTGRHPFILCNAENVISIIILFNIDDLQTEVFTCYLYRHGESQHGFHTCGTRMWDSALVWRAVKHHWPGRMRLPTHPQNCPRKHSDLMETQQAHSD